MSTNFSSQKLIFIFSVKNASFQKQCLKSNPNQIYRLKERLNEIEIMVLFAKSALIKV